MIFSACLPFLTFTYFLRGIDLPSMMVALTLGFAAVILSAQVAVFVACLPVSRAFKFIIALIALSQFLSAYVATMAWTGDMLWRGVGSTLGSANFWQWTGIIALNFGGLLGLLFALSVALIKPASANRALPVRLYLTAIWLIGGAAALIGSWVEATHDPVVFWQTAFNILFAFSILTAVSERDWPGARVLRNVPESGLKRLLCFFFFSGSASGLAWTVMMVTVTYAVSSIWWRLFPTFSNLGDLVGATRWLSVMNLYLLCYALTAALLRRHLLKRMGANFTWLIATALTAIGSTIPFLIGMLVFMNDIDWWREDYGRWLIGNPFAWDVAAHRELYLSIGTAWALLAIAFNLHWFIERARKFKMEN
ncbi:MAG: hypothetical protein AAB401_18410 [Acidobacteriota bacterium]